MSAMDRSDRCRIRRSRSTNQVGVPGLSCSLFGSLGTYNSNFSFPSSSTLGRMALAQIAKLM